MGRNHGADGVTPEFEAYVSTEWDKVRIWISNRQERVLPWIAEVHRIEPTDEGTYSQPTMELDRVFAAKLMTQLWRAGIRPEDQKEITDNTFEAQQRHIAFAEHVATQLLERLDGSE